MSHLTEQELATLRILLKTHLKSDWWSNDDRQRLETILQKLSS